MRTRKDTLFFSLPRIQAHPKGLSIFHPPSLTPVEGGAERGPNESGPPRAPKGSTGRVRSSQSLPWAGTGRPPLESGGKRWQGLPAIPTRPAAVWAPKLGPAGAWFRGEGNLLCSLKSCPLITWPLENPNTISQSAHSGLGLFPEQKRTHTHPQTHFHARLSFPGEVIQLVNDEAFVLSQVQLIILFLYFVKDSFSLG